MLWNVLYHHHLNISTSVKIRIKIWWAVKFTEHRYAPYCINRFHTGRFMSSPLAPLSGNNGISVHEIFNTHDICWALSLPHGDELCWDCKEEELFTQRSWTELDVFLDTTSTSLLRALGVVYYMITQTSNGWIAVAVLNQWLCYIYTVYVLPYQYKVSEPAFT